MPVPTNKLSRKNRWLIGLAIAILIYTITGFFVAPAIIKSQLLQRLPALTKRQATVEEVKVNPYALSLTIRGLALKESNGDLFAGWDELYVNFELSSIFRGAWTFQEISIQKPQAQVTMLADGSFNFSNLIPNQPSAAQPAPTQPLPHVIVETLSITNAEIAFSDLTRKTPFQTKLSPINIHLTQFTTLPKAEDPYSFEATSDSGEKFAWTGKFSLDPLSSSGKFKIEGLDLKKYAPYAADFTTAKIIDGKVAIGADYNAVIAKDGMDVTASAGTLQLANLQIQSPISNETVVTIPTFTVDLDSACLAKRLVTISAVKSSGGSLLLRQNHDGTINLLQLINTPPPMQSPKPASPSASWTIKVSDIAFDNYSAKIEDYKPDTAALLNIDQLAFDLKGFSTETNTSVAETLSLRLNGAGALNVKGTATLMPPTADIAVDVSNLPLSIAQPYIHEQIKLAIATGALDVHGKARYSAPDGPMAHFEGTVAVTNFGTTDLIQFKDFVKFDSLAISGIDFDFQPNRLKVDQVKLAGFSTSVIVNSNKQPNLLAIFPPKPTNNVAASSSGPAMEFPVDLKQLTLERASFHFADQSIAPACAFSIQGFGGTIEGLSSQKDSTATLDISGNVDEFSPFRVNGKINPLSANLLIDLAISVKNMDLTAFTPYMEKYAGYPLNKGKLLLNLDYDINQRQLKASNQVTVADLTLGRKNDSPDATHLPVKLAIALLKDRNGKIILDVPVNGSLDDPKFKVGPIIWQVVMNLLTKAATSPFSLLGALFGGGEELSYVDFQPGQSDIAPAELPKLEKLSKALYERPELNLEISGGVDRNTDREMLARAKLADKIKVLRAQELLAQQKSETNFSVTEIDSTNYTRLLQTLYIAEFGSNSVPTNIASPGTNLITLATNTVVTPTAVSKSSGTQSRAGLKGGQLLFTGFRSGVSTGAPKPIATPANVSSSNTQQNPETTPANSLLSITDMENQLITKIPVTDDDLRGLAQTRSHSVQSALLNSGKIQPERVYLVAPNFNSDATKPLQRVTMSLQ